MEVRAESFWNWAVEEEEKTSDSRGQKYFVWVVGASFCATRYLEDPRSLEDEKQEKESGVVGAGKENVEFRA